MATIPGILVLGGESTGTRLMTRILIASGCYGDDDPQRLDRRSAWDEIGDRPLVWRRSLPHATLWPDIAAMIEELRRAGRDPRACLTVRDWQAAARSQIARGHVRNEETAIAHLRRAYVHALRALDAAGVPYVIASYESLTSHAEDAARGIVEMLGLTYAGLPEHVADRNAKRFQVPPKTGWWVG